MTRDDSKATEAHIYKALLVPLDGSALSEQALGPAVALCRRWAARLHLVHVRTMPRPVSDPDPEQAHFDSVCARTSDDMGESVSFAIIEQSESHLRGGSRARNIAELIAKYVENNDVEMIVMATHGRGGIARAWFGSATDALLRISAIPLFLIRPQDVADATGWNSAQPVRRVLLPLDGSRVALEALEPAAQLAFTFGASLTLLRVVVPVQRFQSLLPPLVADPSVDVGVTVESASAELSDLAAAVRRRDLEVEVSVITDSVPARAILDYARTHVVDLIALATHGPRPLERVLLGSVADKVVRAADCPTLVLRAEVMDDDPVVHEGVR